MTKRQRSAWFRSQRSPFAQVKSLARKNLICQKWLELSLKWEETGLPFLNLHPKCEWTFKLHGFSWFWISVHGALCKSWTNWIHFAIFSSIQSLFTNKSVAQMNAVLQVCSKTYFFPENASLPSAPSIFKTLKSIMLDEESVVYAAIWSTLLKKIGFEPIFTEEGLCYTYNSLNSHEIYSDGWVEMEIKKCILI